MCAVIQIDAPAKVNLGLRIVGLRSDGLHELESLFAPLDLADGLALEIDSARVPEVTLAVGGEASGAPPGDDNLAARAARAFLARAGVSARVAIALTKRTPVAAGLGGGSSDAAAVLRGLAQAFPGALPPAVLEEIALGLGADVPFFLDPRPAWVTGVGERRAPLRGLPPIALLLANPGEALATREVFRAYDALGRAHAARSEPPSAISRELSDDAALAARLHNDLEEPAVRLCPPIARLRARLRASGARAVGMSGSGATLYGVFADRPAAEAARARLALPARAWCRVATTCESR